MLHLITNGEYSDYGIVLLLRVNKSKEQMAKLKKDWEEYTAPVYKECDYDTEACVQMMKNAKYEPFKATSTDLYVYDWEVRSFITKLIKEHGAKVVEFNEVRF